MFVHNTKPNKKLSSILVFIPWLQPWDGVSAMRIVTEAGRFIVQTENPFVQRRAQQSGVHDFS
jgi:hypothetical protein